MSKPRENLERLLQEMHSPSSSLAAQKRHEVDAGPRSRVPRWPINRWLSYVAYAPLLMAAIAFSMAGATLLEKSRASERLSAQQLEFEDQQQRLAGAVRDLEARVVKTESERDGLERKLREYRDATEKSRLEVHALSEKNEALQQEAKTRQDEIKSLKERLKVAPKRTTEYVLDNMSEVVGKIEGVGKESITLSSLYPPEKRVEFKFNENTQLRLYGKPLKLIEIHSLRPGMLVRVLVSKKTPQIAEGIAVEHLK